MKNQIEFCNEELNKKLEPKIYVACLAAYNKGYLHGAWIDAHQDVESLNAEIKKMLEKSPISDTDEFTIRDYDGFGDLTINEYDSLEIVSELASYAAERGKLEIAVLAYANGNVNEARCLLNEHYHGVYPSEEIFAELFAEDSMDIPDHLAYYINYEKMARDLFVNDFFSIKINGKTHVFSYL